MTFRPKRWRGRIESAYWPCPTTRKQKCCSCSAAVLSSCSFLFCRVQRWFTLSFGPLDEMESRSVDLSIGIFRVLGYFRLNAMSTTSKLDEVAQSLTIDSVPNSSYRDRIQLANSKWSFQTHRLRRLKQNMHDERCVVIFAISSSFPIEKSRYHRPNCIATLWETWRRVKVHGQPPISAVHAPPVLTNYNATNYTDVISTSKPRSNGLFIFLSDLSSTI